MNPPQDNLDPWFAAARTELAQEAPPQWVEWAVLAHQAERALLLRLRPKAVMPERPSRRMRWQWLVPAAAAVVLLTAVGLLLFADPAPRGGHGDTPLFMALGPLETIATEPRPVVVTSAVPRAQLAAYGLPIDPARADQPVRAEFLVSRRGAVLAVRFSPD
jgi:hypothetical protein